MWRWGARCRWLVGAGARASRRAAAAPVRIAGLPPRPAPSRPALAFARGTDPPAAQRAHPPPALACGTATHPAQRAHPAQRTVCPPHEDRTRALSHPEDQTHPPCNEAPRLMLPPWGPHHAPVLHPCFERQSGAVGQDQVVPRGREWVVGSVGCRHAREIWVHASLGGITPPTHSRGHSLAEQPSRLPSRQRHSMTSGVRSHTLPGIYLRELCTGEPA